MKPKMIPESYDLANQKLKEIGQKVRKIRKEKYGNYESFAVSKNINKVTLNKIERGHPVSTKHLIHTIHKLEISLQDFFNSL